MRVLAIVVPATGAALSVAAMVNYLLFRAVCSQHDLGTFIGWLFTHGCRT